MSDFLLELRCEEIPARMQAGARAELEKLFRKELDAAGVKPGAITVWSTPRRLALIARDLPEATAAVSEELKGPRVGAPPQALEGFLRKTGLSADRLTERDGVLYAITEKPGRATAAVLAEAIPAIIRSFAWPKSMRWGAASLGSDSLRWVRPLSGIIALLDDAVVPCDVSGISAGQETIGHRFHSSGTIEISSAADYAAKLRDAHVIVDHAERQDLIRTQAAAAAQAAGLTLVDDEGLVIENAGLTEWPVPLLGRFDAAYLDVPPEVIQLTARTNQKYFVCNDAAGKLANAFVCTANIAAADEGEAIVAGNRKVLGARLSDARFFWEQDRKKTLAQHAEGLARITFHEKLGTVADKVERVAKLARRLVEEGIVGNPPQYGEELSLADQAELAARLCKADLVTEMVGEFPELQGLMGGYYARAEGLPDAVADAIRDHYKPVGQGDDVPTAPVTVAVSLADKLDTLVSFFSVHLVPTGSKDPFALRRSVLGVVSIIQGTLIRLSLISVFKFSREALYKQLNDKYLSLTDIASMAGIELSGTSIINRPGGDVVAVKRQSDGYHIEVKVEGDRKDKIRSLYDDLEKFASDSLSLLDFFADRLKVQQREAGVRHDLIDAVFALGGEDDLVRLLARVHALQAFIGTPDGTNLLAGYKRAANILKKEGFEPTFVTPAQAGVQLAGESPDAAAATDSRVRGNDDGEFGLNYTPEPSEAALLAALDSAEPQAAAALAAEDFTAAMAALATLRAPIDAFFEAVMINDPDPAKRAFRLGLLDRFRAAVHKVADFSRIEG